MTDAYDATMARGPSESGAPPSPAEAVERGAVDAILAASHGDPFAVLGPHEVAPGVWDVRVMQPGAAGVDLLDFYEDRLLATCEQTHPEGFFVGRVMADYRPGYRLRIRYDQAERTINDPYLFGSALTGDDIAAISHSNDTAFYFIFGAHPITLGGIWGMRFVVWAPSAKNVSIVGDFNEWDGRATPCASRQEAASGNCSFPASTGARATSTRSAGPAATCR